MTLVWQFANNRMNDLDIEVVAIFRKADEATEFIRTLCDISMQRFNEPDLIKALPYYETDKEEDK